MRTTNNAQRTRLTSTLTSLVCLLPIFLLGCRKEPRESVNKSVLRLATTTSTVDSGLMEILIPIFESRYNIKVEIFAKGSEAVLNAGRQSRADVVLTDARKAEDAFVTEGYGVNQKDVMYNDFVILGPPDDPAGIKKTNVVLEALKQIRQTNAKYVSRGDKSGTHLREIELWKLAGIEPAGSWYMLSNSGMLKTLKMASKSKAYVMSDRSSYLFNKDDLDLVLVHEGDELLLNVYSVMAVNPAKIGGVNFKAAMQFIDFITSLEVQEIIAGFGELRFGRPLFAPLGAE